MPKPSSLKQGPEQMSLKRSNQRCVPITPHPHPRTHHFSLPLGKTCPAPPQAGDHSEGTFLHPSPHTLTILCSPPYAFNSKCRQTALICSAECSPFLSCIFGRHSHIAHTDHSPPPPLPLSTLMAHHSAVWLDGSRAADGGVWGGSPPQYDEKNFSISLIKPVPTLLRKGMARGINVHPRQPIVSTRGQQGRRGGVAEAGRGQGTMVVIEYSKQEQAQGELSEAGWVAALQEGPVRSRACMTPFWMVMGEGGYVAHVSGWAYSLSPPSSPHTKPSACGQCSCATSQPHWCLRTKAGGARREEGGEKRGERGKGRVER
jgi:hypothetical protein